MSENLFGTDGIRDRAGEGMLAPAALQRLGVAVGEHFSAKCPRAPRVLIGRDTRESGESIEADFGGGLAVAGCEVHTAGILPTPAISMLVGELGYDLGIVISASHNPAAFNGVKLFDAGGCKLVVAEEEEMTRRFHAAEQPPENGPAPQAIQGMATAYLDVLLRQLGGDGFLSGMTIALDCARGATATTAREAFERAGATVHIICDETDGARINEGCGSLHPEPLAAVVKETGAALGVAFDGDGDRSILVDEKGGVVDGDEVLTLWALALRDAGQLPGDCLVATVMSNAGMESHLRANGVEMARTPVGDREVFEELRRRGAALGGEQSGHIIYLPEANTGDGVRTGLHIARMLKAGVRPLSELRAEIPRFPQVLLNTEVARKVPFDDLPKTAAAARETEERLAGRGRLLLRYSGTEPLARVLIEGPDADENESLARHLIDCLVEEIGS
ncbi:MAG: phosphoglucosamine mutase [Planctomycetota bacterium]